MSKYILPDLPARIGHKEDLDKLLIHMANSNGSDLFIMGESPIWMSIYGKKERVTGRNIDVGEAKSLLESFYGQHAWSQVGKGKPIDTSYEIRVQTDDLSVKRYRFRVNAVGCIRSGRDSLTVTFRTIPTTPPKWDIYGVEKEIMNVCSKTDQGLILVVGATGNGKSTLLSSVLRDQVEDENSNRNLVTIESPIEFVYDEVQKPSSFATQLEVGRHVQSFSGGVVNSLRMAPNTILIGESRDYETISASIEASVTGHTVFSTVHANSVAETFQRMIATYPEELQHQGKIDLIQAIKLVVAQRLIPSADGKRTAIREYLIFDQEMKNELVQCTNIALSIDEMVEKHGQSMMKDVKNKYDQGLITDEVFERQKANYEKSNSRKEMK